MWQSQLFRKKRCCPYCGDLLEFKSLDVYGDEFVERYNKCSNPNCSSHEANYSGFCFEGFLRSWNEL